MALGVLFWVLMLLWLVGFGYGMFQAEKIPGWPIFVPSVLLFLLVGCLGWQVFGPAIK